LEEIAELPEFCGVTVDSVAARGGTDSTPLHCVVNWPNPEALRILWDAGVVEPKGMNRRSAILSLCLLWARSVAAEEKVLTQADAAAALATLATEPVA
jgi:hypothetical protein